MKKNISRIALLVIALSLFVCAVFAVTVNADESALTPEIISQNVAYQGDFALMYAVSADSVAEGKVTLNLYNNVPTADTAADKIYEANAPETITIDGVKTQAYVFKTKGVSAKDMADVFYVQAIDSAGNKSAVKSYSVAEYLYERLYACNDVTAKQRALYESALIFGANAQAILAEGETPVTDYVYYNVTDGVINGKSSGIVKKSIAYTVTYTGIKANQVGWSITLAGSEQTDVLGNSIALTESAIIAPLYKNLATFEDGSFSGTFYDSFLYGTNEAGSTVCVSVNEKDTLVGTPAPITEYSIVDDPAGAAGKALKVACTKSSDYYAGYTLVTASNDAPQGSTWVFETDIYLESSASSSDVTQIHFQDKDGSTLVSYSLKYQSSEKGLKIIQNNEGGSGTADFAGVHIPEKEWVTLRIEWYQTKNAETTMTKIYVGTDGNEPICVCDAVAYRSYGLTRDMARVNVAHQRTNTTVTYWDNISLVQVERDYVPMTPYVTDFDNEQITYDATYPEIVAGVGAYLTNAMPAEVQAGGSGTPADYRNYKLVDDPDNAANKVLEAYTYYGNSTNVAKTSTSTVVTAQAEGVGGRCYVFEARLRYTAGYGSLTQFFFYDASGNVLYGFLLKTATIDGATKLVLYEQNGKGNGANAIIYDEGIPYGEWFDFRVEFYWEGNGTSPVTRYYVNGEFIYEDSQTWRNAALTSTTYSSEIHIMHQRNATHTLLLDDVVYYNCNKVCPETVTEE